MASQYSSSVASLQHYLPSPFGASSTADEVAEGVDLTGKNIIVTGGYSGIGLETVRVLAAAGARVFVPARDLKRAAEAIKGLKGKIELDTLDLADPKSIDTFVQSFLAKKLPLHILFNNAGMVQMNLERDARGIEKIFAVNHLGPFQLTVGLLPALRAAKGARVINTGSAAHRRSDINFDDVFFNSRAFDVWLAYGQSKTANSLFALELDKRESKNGIRAFSLHPGVIKTNILGDNETLLKTIGVVDANGNTVINPEAGYKTPAQGAATQVFAGLSPLLNGYGGLYLEDTDVASISKPNPDPQARVTGVRLHAIDDANAKRLWELSEQLLASQ